MANKYENFLNRHNACNEAKEWAKKFQITSFEQAWTQCQEPGWLLWSIEQAGYEEKSARRARKWVHQCLLLMQVYLQDPRSLDALSVLEKYVNGTGTPEELASALASAKAAFATRSTADAFAQRCSPHFHAARAVVQGLCWTDDQWAKLADEATASAAKAVALKESEIHHPTLLEHRKKQADLLRFVFWPDVAGLIANLEHLD